MICYTVIKLNNSKQEQRKGGGIEMKEFVNGILKTEDIRTGKYTNLVKEILVMPEINCAMSTIIHENDDIKVGSIFDHDIYVDISGAFDSHYEMNEENVRFE